MRITAPAIGGTAVVLAAALVWRFQPEPPVVPESGDALEPAAEAPAAARMSEVPAAADWPAREVASAAPHAVQSPGLERAPLPGEAPKTPMAELVTERQNLIRRAGAGAPGDEFPPEIVAGELEFAAEPIDATWASGTEADLLATFAQMPGLKLIDLQVECRSTMCRIQLTQPSAAATNGEPVSFNILRDSIGLEPRWMMMVGSGSTALSSVGYFWREGFAPQQEPGEPQLSN